MGSFGLRSNVAAHRAAATHYWRGALAAVLKHLLARRTFGKIVAGLRLGLNHPFAIAFRTDPMINIIRAAVVRQNAALGLASFAVYKSCIHCLSPPVFGHGSGLMLEDIP